MPIIDSFLHYLLQINIYTSLYTIIVISLNYLYRVVNYNLLYIKG